MKANVKIGNDELTVYLNEEPGPGVKPKTCHYCGKKGHKVSVEVESITGIRGPVDAESSLWKEAASTVRRAYLDGRGLCTEDACSDRYSADCGVKKLELEVA